MRHDTKDADTDEYQFQSTHPLRGATCPRRARREGNPISIHAPLAGCDPLSPERFAYSVYFNPRTPCGVRRLTAGRQWDSHNFNPRTPCGVRLCPGCNQKMRCIFQSTHPLRGATTFCSQAGRDIRISIHAPLAGCDYTARYGRYHARHFNPRTPCGVRPYPDYKIKAPD